MKIICGDCIEEMRKMPENSVDSICCDPPYGLGFMGKEWDTFDKSQFGNAGEEGKNDLKVKKNFKTLPRYNSDGLYEFTKEWAIECLRVLKPGGYLLSFAGTRTQHKICMGIEDAGFEIRDMIGWIYGTGFPKSLNVGKAVDKLQGNEREDIGKDKSGTTSKAFNDYQYRIDKDIFSTSGDYNITKGNSKWEGYGTALKPSLEPITVARKPLSEKTVAKNVLKWGTGGINIDGCRIGTETRINKGMSSKQPDGAGTFRDDNWVPKEVENIAQGRFPSNLIHDGSEEVLSVFPNSKGQQGNVKGNEQSHTGQSGIYNNYERVPFEKRDDSGSAARFFYCAKASKKDRNEGLDEFEEKISCDRNPKLNSANVPMNRSNNPTKNSHPTVKPTKLMQYLVRLVTPKGGVCLDPFLGSGSTGKACVIEGFDFMGIEKDEEYCKIAEARVNYPIEKEQVKKENKRSLLDY